MEFFAFGGTPSRDVGETGNMKVWTAKDASPEVLKGVPVALIGYGAQGRAQALCFRDSGLDLTVGVRPSGPSWRLAQSDGLKVAPIAEAARDAQLIHILIPDECHKEVYEQHVGEHVTSGKTLGFSHGFSIVFGCIVPPQGVDVVMVAPKGPGPEVRKAFLAGTGLAGIVAVARNPSGTAQAKALAMAHALGLTRTGVLSCTFEQEAYEDLFGEQAVLCGGTAELIKAAFEILVEKGYPPEMAYFECLHELKLTVDLIHRGGLTHMWEVVSNTAEYGGRTAGTRIVTAETRAAMRQILQEVCDGSFARRWMQEHEAGLPHLKQLRATEAEHPIEKVGEKLRKLLGAEIET